MQLYSAREKEELNHVISVMIDYNLNYVQERTQEGTYVYNLDPWVSDTMTCIQYGFFSCITVDMVHFSGFHDILEIDSFPMDSLY